jgi:hypothetical protein
MSHEFCRVTWVHPSCVFGLLFVRLSWFLNPDHRFNGLTQVASSYFLCFFLISSFNIELIKIKFYILF